MSIFFACPMYAGHCMKPFFESCLHIQESLLKAGVPHTFCIVSDSAVHRGRNQLVKAFLESGYDRLFFLDSDLEFSAEDIGKIWALDADVGVGVYPMKEVGAPHAAWVDGALISDLDQYAGKPTPVDYAGTGFMCIKRHVFEKMKPFTEVEEFQMLDRKTNGFRYIFFNFPTNELQKERAKEIARTIPCSRVVRELPEDFGFCKKTRELGMKVIMDPTVRLKHYGLYGYDGKL